MVISLIYYDNNTSEILLSNEIRDFQMKLKELVCHFVNKYITGCIYIVCC